jgi:hypothetical protein
MPVTELRTTIHKVEGGRKTGRKLASEPVAQERKPTCPLTLVEMST